MKITQNGNRASIQLPDGQVIRISTAKPKPGGACNLRLSAGRALVVMPIAENAVIITPGDFA